MKKVQVTWSRSPFPCGCLHLQAQHQEDFHVPSNIFIQGVSLGEEEDSFEMRCHFNLAHISSTAKCLHTGGNPNPTSHSGFKTADLSLARSEDPTTSNSSICCCCYY